MTLQRRPFTCLLSALLVLALLGTSQSLAEPQNNYKRERIEWVDVWIPEANSDDLPRVLLIGDSITRAYYNTVNSLLKDKATCARFATSACVSDPAFLEQLRAVSSGYEFDIIHFNNGLHGFDYSESEYQAGYDNAIELIRKLQPKAKIIFALSTPLQSTSDKVHLNPRIDVRNRHVESLAKKLNASINNLYAISKDHPEFYTDPYHFKPNAIQLQGKQVSEHILKELKTK